MDDFQAAVEEELSESRLVNFVNDTDRVFEDAWHDHYSRPQRLDRILKDNVAARLLSTIKNDFPLHYSVLRSLIFSKRAHQPARRERSGYKQKEQSLVNHFLALVRLRSPEYLIHWAIIGTMSMYNNGVNMKQYRNPGLRSFSADIRTTFRKLDETYEATRPEREAFIRKQQIIHHASDNFQQAHRLLTAREGKRNDNETTYITLGQDQIAY